MAAAHEPNVDGGEDDDEDACHGSDAPNIHLSLSIGAAGVSSSHCRPKRMATAIGAPATMLPTEVDRLLHLTAISSGDAFDRALLAELRRLSLHRRNYRRARADDCREVVK